MAIGRLALARAAGLGDPVQRAGNGRSPSLLRERRPKLDAMHKAFVAQIVEEGPIPAIHGVMRWRACDLIMRLHEEFGLSVSDDTIYRALKKLGFSHVSGRPKAYKQDAEGHGGVQKKFAERVAEIRAALAPGIPVGAVTPRRSPLDRSAWTVSQASSDGGISRPSIFDRALMTKSNWWMH